MDTQPRCFSGIALVLPSIGGVPQSTQTASRESVAEVFSAHLQARRIAIGEASLAEAIRRLRGAVSEPVGARSKAGEQQ